MTFPHRRIGILGGSFNPIHIGHILLAEYIAQFSEIDEVWFTLSPLNPLKAHPEELVDDNIRLEMLKTAVCASPRLHVCDIELSMPRPSYTADTLDLLSAKYPEYRFSLVIGSDNWLIFDHWYRYRHIIDHFFPIIYPRPNYPIDNTILPHTVKFIQAPTIDMSSTFIRQSIANGYDMTNFLPNGVYRHIIKYNLYQ